MEKSYPMMLELDEDQEKSINFSRCSRTMMVSSTFFAGLVVAIIVIVPIVSLRFDGKGETKEGTIGPLFIAAFNIKSFGESKLGDKFILKHIVQILSRYDIALVQEVRDQSGKALKGLWKQLNATGTPYGLVHSERLGRSQYKEQYAFFYRTSATQPTGTLQHDDSPGDKFEREPYTVEFQYYSMKYQTKRQVALMALHTKPKEADIELAELPAVMRSTLKHFSLSDGVIALGDFNADCAYLSNKKKNKLELFNHNSSFKSILHHSTDTTVASTTDCAYDRAVVLGKSVKTSDAVIFDFQAAFHLSESDAKKISDHFPIEFKLF